MGIIVDITLNNEVVNVKRIGDKITAVSFVMKLIYWTLAVTNQFHVVSICEELSMVDSLANCSHF